MRITAISFQKKSSGDNVYSQPQEHCILRSQTIRRIFLKQNETNRFTVLIGFMSYILFIIVIVLL